MGSKYRVLVVEDDPGALELLAEYLESDYEVATAQDAFSCLRSVTSKRPDLVLLDVMLPDESGFNLCKRLRELQPPFFPILLVTALNTTGDRVRGLEAGADDFVSKPFLKEELMARVRSHLRTKAMVDEVERLRVQASEFNKRLQLEVERATRDLEKAVEQLQLANEEMAATHKEIMDRLGCVAEYRDPETGGHARRVASLVYILAQELGLPAATCEMYRMAAPLHDIGKLAIRDRVLLKPADLDEREAELVREHTAVGARILSNPRTPVVEIAYFMASGHHERWDGRGYPNGLAGDAIPLPARVCAVADAFDAMTSGRVYRPEPMTDEQAGNQLQEGAGTAFDPEVVQAFMRALPGIKRARAKGELAGEELCKC